MGLNESKGNMYDFVTHTWNTIKGECYHDCSYCYMKRWGKQKPVRFDEKELKTDLGSGNFIFVGSSCDMFAKNIPDEWITKTFSHCLNFDNKYLFQTKNPKRFLDFMENPIMDKSVLCTTIESNRWYKDVMKNSPQPQFRFYALDEISKKTNIPLYLTIEPVLDFNLEVMIDWLKIIKFEQVNIGADSGNNNLPEPSKEKVLLLIDELKNFTTINNKSNLKRLLNV